MKYIYSIINLLKGGFMKLNPPKRVTWLIALLAGILAILSQFTSIPFITANSFLVLAAGWLLLILATFLKNL